MSFWWRDWDRGDSARLAILLACLAIAVCVWFFKAPNRVTIKTGGIYQEILPSVTPKQRHSLTIQNVNRSTEIDPGDNCWVAMGDTTPTKQTSILLMPGGSYMRYQPYILSDQIMGTCEKSGDQMYVKAE